MPGLGIADWCLGASRGMTVGSVAQLGLRKLHLGIAEVSDLDDPTGNRVQERIRSCTEHDVEVACLALNCVEELGLLSSGDNAASAALCQHAARAALEVAAAFAVPLIYIPSFGKSEILSRDDMEETAGFIRRLCRQAADTGTLVASENSLDAAGNELLVKAVDQPNFRILLDIYNPGRWRHSPTDIIDLLFDRLADQVHVKDGIDGGFGNIDLGRGDGNVDHTIAVLGKRGFSGTFVLENDYHADPIRLLRDIAHLNRLVGDRT